MKKTLKRKYTSHLNGLKAAHEELLIRHAQKGWQEAEQALKKHETIQKAKRAGIEVSRWILGLGLAAGALSIALVAPNAFAAVAKVAGIHAKRTYAWLPESKFDRQLRQGSSRKYWRYAKTGAHTYKIELTKKGKAVALRTEMRNFKLESYTRWDGKWRILMFDIPKKYSATRDGLRRKLYEIGMYSIQESVFAYPYPCQEEIIMWVELFGMEKHVETAEAIFNSDLNNKLKRIFQIKI